MVKVLLPLMTGFEEIEAVTVIDLLRRAGVEVVTAGLSPNPIQGAHGIPVLADTTLETVTVSGFDGIILPGGAGTKLLREDPRVHRLTLAFAEQKLLVAAICAAPTVLSQLGLLQDKQATSYPTVQDQMQVAQYLTASVVVDRNFITSRGAGTALDFALALVRYLVSPAQAQQVATSIVALHTYS